MQSEQIYVPGVAEQRTLQRCFTEFGNGMAIITKQLLYGKLELSCTLDTRVKFAHLEVLPMVAL